ncbi:MAG TPA: winged helix-turn-helix domain-containing protein [Blastocatellia bacterium]|nr:winged helix-turn-helix domain-containing protein [Blastocatellia bacterium]
MLAQTMHIYEFGPFRLIPQESQLLRDGQPVALTPKAFNLLVVLIEQSGHLVEKDELLRRVWPDSFVEEANLSVKMTELRRALGKGPNDHLYIETVPKRGYRFVASVRECSGVDQKTPQGVAPAKEPLPRKSIAVLPFKSLNLQADEQYLGVGIADSLITRLSTLQQLKVRSTSAVLRYASGDYDPLTVGREMQVEYLLEGMIAKAGARIRITAQLLRADDGVLLWADRFDEDFTNFIALEDAISEKLIQNLLVTVSNAEKAQLLRRHTESAEAYQLYMKGRYFWNQRTPTGFRKGIEYFTGAIEKDPSYALAHAGLADSYLIWTTYGTQPPHELMPKAKEAATRALEIDGTLAEAYASLAFANLVYDWDWPNAKINYKRAIEMKPNYAIIHIWYGFYLIATSRFEEAFAAGRRAQELDPLSLIISNNLGWFLYFARHYDRAVEQFLGVLEMDANFWRPHWNIGLCYVAKGMFGEAIAAFEKARSLCDIPVTSTSLGRAHALSGDRTKAMEILRELRERARREYVSPYYMAEIYAGLGETEESLDCLERAYRERVWFLVFLNYEPIFDNLRTDQRFRDLIRRIGLPT